MPESYTAKELEELRQAATMAETESQYAVDWRAKYAEDVARLVAELELANATIVELARETTGAHEIVTSAEPTSIE